MPEPGARPSPLSNVAVVLCRPQMPENIGTAARAAANMGLGRLIVVDPFRMDQELMLNAATRAGQKLVQELTVHQDLETALSDFHFVAGTTARPGSHRGPFYTPRNLAGKILSFSSSHQAALVFGPERTGLTTEELRLCQTVVRIPTAGTGVSSLNLAQAVLILGYELLLAGTGDISPPSFKPAPQSEVEAMYEHLAQTLLTIGFLPDENTGHWLMSFKRIFNRTGLTHGECNLLRGMCRQILWAVRNREN